MNQPTLPGMAGARIRRTAVIDPTGQYRYQLSRAWDDETTGYVNWIMLNPSTGDDQVDDPTIRRCVHFTKSWGYGGLLITNLFAYRSTDPQALFTCPDPIGPENDYYQHLAALGAQKVILAWGHHGWILEQASKVLVRLAKLDVRCHSLGLTQHGEPKHPLFLKQTTEPQPFDIRKTTDRKEVE